MLWLSNPEQLRLRPASDFSPDPLGGLFVVPYWLWLSPGSVCHPVTVWMWHWEPWSEAILQLLQLLVSNNQLFPRITSYWDSFQGCGGCRDLNHLPAVDCQRLKWERNPILSLHITEYTSPFYHRVFPWSPLKFPTFILSLWIQSPFPGRLGAGRKYILSLAFSVLCCLPEFSVVFNFSVHFFWELYFSCFLPQVFFFQCFRFQISEKLSCCCLAFCHLWFGESTCCSIL